MSSVFDDDERDDSKGGGIHSVGEKLFFELCIKFMESLHGVAPWALRIDAKYTLGKSAGQVFTECPSKITILWDSVYGHNSNS